MWNNVAALGPFASHATRTLTKKCPSYYVEKSPKRLGINCMVKNRGDESEGWRQKQS